MTIELSRRQLMASAGGMVLASFALPSTLRKIIESAPPARLNSARATAPLSEIKHVVVLMQENRSFDHYFGAMPGVRGFGDPQAIPGVFKQADPDNPGRVPVPVPRRHAQHECPEPALDQPQLATAARLVEQRGHERLRDRAAQLLDRLL